MKIAIIYEPSDNTQETLLPRERKRRVGRRPRRKRAKLDREQVADALRAVGHQPVFHELHDRKSLLDLAGSGAELVFNMVEGFDGGDTKEAHVAGFLELMRLR